MKIWIHRLIGIVIAAIVLLFVFFFVNAAGYGWFFIRSTGSSGTSVLSDKKAVSEIETAVREALSQGDKVDSSNHSEEVFGDTIFLVNGVCPVQIKGAYVETKSGTTEREGVILSVGFSKRHLDDAQYSQILGPAIEANLVRPR